MTLLPLELSLMPDDPHTHLYPSASMMAGLAVSMPQMQHCHRRR